jgi:hypothetical protein
MNNKLLTHHAGPASDPKFRFFFKNELRKRRVQKLVAIFPNGSEGKNTQYCVIDQQPRIGDVAIA